MPDFVLYDASGRPMSRFDDFALPHVLSFSGITRGAAHSYLHGLHDEAIKHSRENALAMRRDAWLQSLLRERIDGTLALKWHLEVDSPKDSYQKLVVEGLTRAVKRTRRLRGMLWSLMQALWFGRMGVQVKWAWQVIDGTRTLTVRQHQPVNGDKIGYQFNGTPYVLIHGGEGIDQLGAGADIITTSLYRALLLRGGWRDRFLIHQHRIEDADFFEPTMAGRIGGIGIRDQVYWLFWLRDEYLAWVVNYMERAGLGIVVVYFEQGNAASEAAADEVAAAYGQRTIIKIPRPPGTLQSRTAQGAHGIEIVETPTAGVTVLQELRSDIEEKIERFIIGQTLSADHRGSGGLGGSGAAEFQQGTKHQIIVSDAESLAESLTGGDEEPGLISVMKRWTYPWADFPVRWVFDVEEVDPEAKLEAIVKATSIGVDFIKTEVRALTGMSDPTPEDEVVGGEQQQAPGGMGAGPGTLPAESGPGAAPLDANGKQPGSPGATNGKPFGGGKRSPKPGQAQYAGEWDEDEHPRDAGRFAEKAGSRGASKLPAKERRRAREQEALEKDILDDQAHDNRIHGAGKHEQVRPDNEEFTHPDRVRVEGLVEESLRSRTALVVSYFPKDGATVFHSGKGKDVWLSRYDDGLISISIGSMNRKRVIPGNASREEVIAKLNDLLGIKKGGQAQYAGEWKEGDHPRADDGTFGSGSGDAAPAAPGTPAPGGADDFDETGDPGKDFEADHAAWKEECARTDAEFATEHAAWQEQVTALDAAHEQAKAEWKAESERAKAAHATDKAAWQTRDNERTARRERIETDHVSAATDEQEGPPSPGTEDASSDAWLDSAKGYAAACVQDWQRIFGEDGALVIHLSAADFDPADVARIQALGARGKKAVEGAARKYLKLAGKLHDVESELALMAEAGDEPEFMLDEPDVPELPAKPIPLTSVATPEQIAENEEAQQAYEEELEAFKDVWKEYLTGKKAYDAASAKHDKVHARWEKDQTTIDDLDTKVNELSNEAGEAEEALIGAIPGPREVITEKISETVEKLRAGLLEDLDGEDEDDPEPDEPEDEGEPEYPDDVPDEPEHPGHDDEPDRDNYGRRIRALHYDFDESKHKRGQPANKGQFGPGGSGGNSAQRRKERRKKGADAPAPAPDTKPGWKQRAASAVAGKAKELRDGVIARAKSWLTPSGIAAKARALCRGVAHPVETSKEVKTAAIGKFNEMKQKYGTSGALAIAGGYVGYYTAAAMNPVMLTVPVPLTFTVITTARLVRWAEKKMRGIVDEPVATAGAAQYEFDESKVKRAGDGQFAEKAGESAGSSASSASGTTVDPKLRDQAKQWVSRSELPDALREKFTEDLAFVLEKMTPGCRAAAETAISAYGGGMTFHADFAAVRAALEKATGRKEKSKVGGFVKHRPGGDSVQVHLDGGSETGPSGDKARGIYAHEMGHAVDAGLQYSSDPKWKAAWKSEIKSGKNLLSRYATESEAEGFAELHRSLCEDGLEATRKGWPKCCAFLAAKGLIG